MATKRRDAWAVPNQRLQQSTSGFKELRHAPCLLSTACWELHKAKLLVCESETSDLGQVAHQEPVAKHTISSGGLTRQGIIHIWQWKGSGVKHQLEPKLQVPSIGQACPGDLCSASTVTIGFAAVPSDDDTLEGLSGWTWHVIAPGGFVCTCCCCAASTLHPPEKLTCRREVRGQRPLLCRTSPASKQPLGEGSSGSELSTHRFPRACRSWDTASDL